MLKVRVKVPLHRRSHIPRAKAFVPPATKQDLQIRHVWKGMQARHHVVDVEGEDMRPHEAWVFMGFVYNPNTGKSWVDVYSPARGGFSFSPERIKPWSNERSEEFFEQRTKDRANGSSAKTKKGKDPNV